MGNFLNDFIFFFAVIDPIGSIPVFIAVTKSLGKGEHKHVAYKSVGISAILLLAFVVGGQLLLDAIDIPLPAFQIAGGIVLFLFAVSMIFGPSKPESEISSIKKTKDDVAVFPMAVPSIASPGAMMAAVLLTDNNRYNIMEQVETSGSMLAVLALTLACLLLAKKILDLIGETGANVMSKISGLILASVAVNSVLTGLQDYF
jgi:multiple antibiotic resistance protein